MWHSIAVFFLAAASWAAPRPAATVLKRQPPPAPDARIELTAPAPIMPAISPLDATGIEASRLSEAWRKELSRPTMRRDGCLQYEYGVGQPVLVCSPLRLCSLELEQGEKILGEPQLGDIARWNMSPASYGSGEDTTMLVVLKPKTTDLDTDVMVATNRRVYNVRIQSNESGYTPRVCFRYPEDDAKKWQAQSEAQKVQETKLVPVINKVEKLNFAYRITGKEALRPSRVFDDGAKTYIQPQASMAHREAPALLVMGDDNHPVLSNYRVSDTGMYILDRLADRMELRIGSGRKAQKVQIVREGGS